MAATFCSQTARPVPVRACASGDRPLIKVAAVLPRIKGAVAAGAAAALLVAAPPALAADLFVGEEIFNANCGGLVGSLCGSSSSSSASSVRSGRSGDAWQTPGSSDGSSSSNGGSSSSSSSAGVPLPLAGPGRLPPARLDSSGSGLARGSPWVPGGPGSRALLRRPLLRAKRPAALMLLQAACHTGGQNSVQLEKTLDKAALEQYLTGGFNIEAIETQVENGKGAMPAWGGRLSEEEIQGVAAYVFKQADGNLW